MNCRATLVVTTCLVLLTSGCLGAVTGPATFTASPADVDRAAATNHGYEKNGTRTQVTERTFEAAGVSKTVAVENRVTTYEKALDIPLLGTAKLGVVGVVSTPAVEVGGEAFNPIEEYDNDRLVRLLDGQYERVDDVQQVSSRSVTVLGTETRVTKYSATATFGGRSVETFVHVTKVRDGEDFVVAVGIYPRALDQEEAVLSLFRAIEHPA